MSLDMPQIAGGVLKYRTDPTTKVSSITVSLNQGLVFKGLFQYC